MDRRIEQRFDCADDVTISWTEKTGTRQHEALLMNISRSGARLLSATRVPVGADVTIAYPNGEFVGQVTHCLTRKPHHVLGVVFAPGFEWSRNIYCPKNARGLGRLPKSA
ncbi:MAG: PilZ domain-containing protein [Bryobacteraceae bacterium]